MATKKTVTKKGAKKRVAKAIRFRKLRGDAKAEAAIAELAARVGVPPKAIKVSYPNGRDFRSDSTVANLRQAWKDQE